MDKPTIVTTYCLRDINADPTVTIINALKKLNYYNLNNTLDTKKFIIHQLRLGLNDDKYLNNINDISLMLHKLKNSDQYSKHYESFLHKIKRATQLSKFLAEPNLHKFYSSLEYEELAYLGF